MIKKLDKKFWDVTKVKLSTTSYLRLFNILKQGNTTFLNIFKTYGINQEEIKSDKIFDYYTVGPNDWWDNIATAYYQNPNLWWIIPLINNIVDPFEGVEEGTTIKILNSNYIYIILRDIDRLASLGDNT